jgi:hypothetical protein
MAQIDRFFKIDGPVVVSHLQGGSKSTASLFSAIANSAPAAGRAPPGSNHGGERQEPQGRGGHSRVHHPPSQAPPWLVSAFSLSFLCTFSLPPPNPNSAMSPRFSWFSSLKVLELEELDVCRLPGRIGVRNSAEGFCALMLCPKHMIQSLFSMQRWWIALHSQKCIYSDNALSPNQSLGGLCVFQTG